MSLGALGQYGSDSSISDSDEEEGKSKSCEKSDHSSSFPTEPADHTPPPPPPADPLGLLDAGSESSSPSNSDTESPPPSDSLQATTPLPLPDIDKIVARNPSYSISELVKKQSASHEEKHDAVEENAGESSVFFNRYKKEEEAKLAVLKQHVSEFDKKPEVKARSEDFKPGFSPPTTYARHSGASISSTSHSDSRTATYTRHDADKRSWNNPHPPPGKPITGSDLFDDNDSSSFAKRPRKHRSGVVDSLRPPKKFMKLHEKIQAQERPWTLNNK